MAKLKVETSASDFFLQAPIHDQHQMRQVVQSLCPARCRIHTDNPPNTQMEIHGKFPSMLNICTADDLSDPQLSSFSDSTASSSIDLVLLRYTDTDWHHPVFKGWNWVRQSSSMTALGTSLPQSGGKDWNPCAGQMLARWRFPVGGRKGVVKR